MKKNVINKTDKKAKKLTINRETVRNLTPRELMGVAGGMGCFSHTGTGADAVC